MVLKRGNVTVNAPVQTVNPHILADCHLAHDLAVLWDAQRGCKLITGVIEKSRCKKMTVIML